MFPVVLSSQVETESGLFNTTGTFSFIANEDTQFPLRLVNKGTPDLIIITDWQYTTYNHALDIQMQYDELKIDLDYLLEDISLERELNIQLTSSVEDMSESFKQMSNSLTNIESDNRSSQMVFVKEVKKVNESIKEVSEIVSEEVIGSFNKKIQRNRLFVAILGGGLGYFIGHDFDEPVLGFIVGAGASYLLTYTF